METHAWWLLPTVLTGILVLLRWPELVFVGLVGAVVVNLRLETSLAGVPVTGQRVFALGAILILALRALIWPSFRLETNRAQILFNVCFGALWLIAAGHFLLGERAGFELLLNLALNIVLFNLTVWSLSDLDQEQLVRAFYYLIPAVVFVGLFYFLSSYPQYLAELMAGGGLDGFRTGYRLRADSAINIINVWAASLVLAVPLVWIPLATGARGWPRTLSALAVLALLACIVLTFSRSALFGLGAFFGGYAFLRALPGLLRARRRSSPRRQLLFLVGFPLFGLLSLWGLSLAGVPIWELLTLRLGGLFQGGDASISVRYASAQHAWSDLAQAPFLGNGPGKNLGHNAPENTFLYLAVRYGVFGLSLFCGFLVLLGLRLWNERTRMSAQLHSSWVALLGAYGFLLLTNDFLYFSMGSISLGILTVFAERRAALALVPASVRVTTAPFDVGECTS